nr:hypothetical protein [uncultured Shinella sp.]
MFSFGQNDLKEKREERLRTVIVFAVLAMLHFATESRAEESPKLEAMRQLVHLIAIINTCPEAIVNLAEIGRRNADEGVDLEKDKIELNRLYREQLERLKSNGREAACAEGMQLFGPEGEISRNSIRLP